MESHGEQEEVAEEVAGDDLTRRLTQKNTLPLYGNKETMNINPMILSNIQGSAYFKEGLYALKTFHEVVDEIFYKVDHLEPWEKGSRKLAGQVGMCGGVRGVAAGGIVSTAFCLLYKLFTLKLTRRQVQAMMDHVDSPYIRGLGFIYVRYCQPPADFWDWFVPYLDDPEEIDLKAGGGFKTTVGALCRMMLSKLDWFGTMLPRMSVNISKVLIQKLKALSQPDRFNEVDAGAENGEYEIQKDVWGEAARRAKSNEQPVPPERRENSPPGRRYPGDAREHLSHSRERYSCDRRKRSRSRDKYRRRSRSHDRRSRSKERRGRSWSRGRRHSRSRSGDRRRAKSRSRDRKRSHSRDRKRSISKERDRKRSHSRDRKRSISKERDRKWSHSRDRKRSRSRKRSHSRDRKRSHSRDRKRSHSRDRKRFRSRDRKRSRSRERGRNRSHDRNSSHHHSSSRNRN